jgi:uncharacterized phage-like protein YoqJ
MAELILEPQTETELQRPPKKRQLVYKTPMIVAGTGHRPSRLASRESCYSSQVLKRLVNLASTHLQYLEPDQVMSGMAQGWDTAIALAALKFHIPLICANPFQRQEQRWTLKAQERYHKLCDRAQAVTIISSGDYSKEKMLKRDRWLVDHSTLLLALWDGRTSGTAHCIRYAKRLHRPVKNVWKDWLTLAES